MTAEIERENQEALDRLLQDCGLIGRSRGNGSPSELQIEILAGDGSSRRFWRIRQKDQVLCLVAAPATKGEQDLAEARSARLIGLHLKKQGVPVPDQYGWDEESGLILFEDLGDEKLHDLVRTSAYLDDRHTPDRLLMLYDPVVRLLARMQIQGAQGFDSDWCWETPHYDIPLMLERESGYFYRALWQDLLDQEVVAGLDEEFVELAHRALRNAPQLFLHRDFQSRNIMINDGRPRFIDYQGGRMGPPGYDLASLLIDPYVELPQTTQEQLLAIYLQEYASQTAAVPKKFQQTYLCLAVQRNLQILGAFSFLSRVRKKSFFARFIPSALRDLEQRLANDIFDDFPILRRVSSQASRLF
ncbi:MAG: phosphotransferase [Desulfobulbaceae bacterium]|uniref:Phosphotransferase n=1 Tax=Candidatus Desulfatifera sulfidica TaxID=2841691 RepID=A0A8J6N5C0_9BACT|nr:phosphotransferase [Candidatus Desulfatifera sulfidica]